MYIERKSERSLLLVPNIVKRQVNEKVIVGFSHLQERLATGDIREQSRGIAPYRIGRRHIYRRIKEPARPLGITRRIGCSMKKHVIDSGREHEIEIGLTLRQRRAEMLGKPCKCLGRDISFSRYMCSGRGIFEHGKIGIVVFLDRIAAQTFNAEIGNTETFTLGNIYHCIKIDEISGRTMRLISY